MSFAFLTKISAFIFTLFIALCILNNQQVNVQGRATTAQPCIHSCSRSVYKPICGTDGKNYDSMCILISKNKCDGTKIRKAYEGRCRAEKKTPSVSQQRNVQGRGESLYDVTNLTTSATTAQPCIYPCFLIFKPICGTDGKIYNNDCFLQGKNVCDRTTITKAYDGVCTNSTQI